MSSVSMFNDNHLAKCKKVPRDGISTANDYIVFKTLSSKIDIRLASWTKTGSVWQSVCLQITNLAFVGREYKCHYTQKDVIGLTQGFSLRGLCIESHYFMVS